jgi:endonuclease/exonuclease/phosphatase family metal-dependent hydrolase
MSRRNPVEVALHAITSHGKRLTLAARALCALSLAAVAGCAHRTGARTGAATPMRVLVYNIHAGKDAAGVDNLERVAAIVRATHADVVLLQEVDRGTTRSGGVDQPATLAKLTGLHAAFGASLEAFQGGKYGIAILSRWPISSQRVERLPVEPVQERSGSHEPRSALVATLAAPGGALTVLNTHLDASGEERYRMQEVATLVTLAAREEGRARFLAGGDFNSTPESGPQGRLRSAGWRDVWASCGVGDGKSYPETTPVKRIDYLFVSQAARCVTAEVLPENASDHRPVLVTLEIGASAH